jgi:hypothetical protein
VWIVIRLCTDEDRVIQYWNAINAQLEGSMDILDDLQGEAREVNEHNPWLTYGEPMHRLREWGVKMTELNYIDEGSLSAVEMANLCEVL